jgi:hypothetical protein
MAKKNSKAKIKKPSAKIFLSELKSITVKNIFAFIAVLFGLYVILRYAVSNLIFKSGTIGKYNAFKPLTSCNEIFVGQTKFYDLYSYFQIYVKHGTGLMKIFYFLLVPLGIYLLLTSFVWKKASPGMKILSLLIGIAIAVLIYVLVPTIYVCTLNIDTSSCTPPSFF